MYSVHACRINIVLKRSYSWTSHKKPPKMWSLHCSWSIKGGGCLLELGPYWVKILSHQHMVMVTAKSLPCFNQIHEKSILRKKNTCMALSINRFPFLLLSTVGKKQISLAFSHVLINNALLHHFLAHWLAHNKKMTEKSVFFCEAWSSEMMSQLFPVSCFGSHGFVLHRKWFDTFGTSKHGEGKSLSKKFVLLYLSVH